MSNIYIHTYIYIVDVDGLFYVCKMVEIHHKKKSSIINIYFKVLKKMDTIYNDLKY
jgi:hypothetical protein